MVLLHPCQIYLIYIGKLEALLGFIIGRYNINHITYAGYTVLMADTSRQGSKGKLEEWIIN